MLLLEMQSLTLSRFLFSCSESKIICLNLLFSMFAVNWSVIFVLPSVLSPTPKNNNESVCMYLYVLCSFRLHTCMHTHKWNLNMVLTENLVGRFFFCETCHIRFLSQPKKNPQNQKNFQTTVWKEHILTTQIKHFLYKNCCLVLESLCCNFKMGRSALFRNSPLFLWATFI